MEIRVLTVYCVGPDSSPALIPLLQSTPGSWPPAGDTLFKASAFTHLFSQTARGSLSSQPAHMPSMKLSQFLVTDEIPPPPGSLP